MTTVDQAYAAELRAERDALSTERDQLRAELDRLHEDLFELSDAQKAAIAQIGSEGLAKWGIDSHQRPDYIVYQPQYRRGRGHDIVAIWSDGEKQLIAYLDVYGNGESYVHDLTLVHGGEECDCDHCEAEARAEEAQELRDELDKAIYMLAMLAAQGHITLNTADDVQAYRTGKDAS